MDKWKLYIFVGGGALVFFLVLLFTGVLPGLQTASDKPANLVMWGFQENEKVWKPILQRLTTDKPNLKVQYQQKNLQTFEQDLLNTLARGQAPDIIVFPSNYLLRQADKLSPAPSGLVSERSLQQDYVDAAAFFWNSQLKTVVAVPLYADVLVLYSNKGLLAKHFIPQPPKTWDTFIEQSRSITQKDAANNIIIAGAAMGRASNINHAPDILATLFLQFGEPIIIRDEKAERITIGQGNIQGNVMVNPSESALRFFSDFANPKKAVYSWSSALPEARDLFLQERLAFYIGSMSEYQSLHAQNPHLDIAVSMLPQLTGAARPVTSGALYALAVPRASRNYTAAWNAVAYLASPQGSGAAFTNTIGTVLPRRDVLGSYQKEAVRSVFAESVLAMKLWRNPNPLAVYIIFRTMIENVAVGRTTFQDALRDARSQLEALVR